MAAQQLRISRTGLELAQTTTEIHSLPTPFFFFFFNGEEGKKIHLAESYLC